MVQMMTLIFVIVFSTALVCSSDAAASSSSIVLHKNETDRLALLAFKDRITSDPFGALRSWNSTTPICNWDGVICGTKHPQRVAGLRLASRGLSGTISPAISNLSFLRSFALENNSFHGEIPHEIGGLFRLRYLDLSSNSLLGVVPANLSRCADLYYLNLSSNRLSRRIPSEIGSLSSLKLMDLSKNNLNGPIPSSLGNLSSLVRLKFSFNRLQGIIPEEFGRLSKLESIEGSHNMLSGTITSSFFNLSSLSDLILATNQLRGSLPASLGIALPKLQYILLGGNNFRGPIPVSLSNATSLRVIGLSDNLFGGPVSCDFGRLRNLQYLNVEDNKLEAHDAKDWRFFDTLANCSQLQSLSLFNNSFAGTFPASVANLSAQIESLYIAMNDISGSIPTGIDKLENLRALVLDYNRLSGPIPAGIGKLSGLQLLGLGSNRLTGGVPSALGNLSQLFVLDVSTNGLDGLIPSSLGRLQMLALLDLSDNNLNGSIPEELLRISSLSKFLDLSSNLLSGPLPDVGPLKNLAQLLVNDNKLSGKIPSTLGKCEILEVLALGMNNFEGTIPLSLSNLKALQVLHIAENNLTGPVPETLENLRSLYLLNLSFNNLEGPVPTMGVFRNASALALFGNHRLCGGIPELKLPRCFNPIESNQKGGRGGRFKIIISGVAAISCVITIGALVFLYKRYSKTKDLSPPLPLRIKRMSLAFSKNQFPKVSYRELARATDGFSSANLIGGGRYGSVYKGTLAINGATLTVAVKVLNLQVRGSSKSFDTECRLLKSVKHRNLLKILTTCSSLDAKGGEFKALIFEYMPNGSLDKWLDPNEEPTQDRHGLGLSERLNIAIDIAKALEYLHHDCQPPILHCDLKPSNILLDDDMVAHVGDFGISKLLLPITDKPLQNTSNTSAINGSIGYVAPEYGAGAAASTAGDVYSYGILLLEIITGKRPVDDMFKDGLTLRSYAEMNSSVRRVMAIADPSMLLRQDEQINKEDQSNGHQVDDVPQFLSSTVEVALRCSAESPSERISVATAANKLHQIRDMYFC